MMVSLLYYYPWEPREYSMFNVVRSKPVVVSLFASLIVLSCTVGGCSPEEDSSVPAHATDAGSTDPADVNSTPHSEDASDADVAIVHEACTLPFSVATSRAATPPYSGTSFISPDIITDADPTSFVDLAYTGQANRTMFDRRTASFNAVNAYLFDAQFGANTNVEIQVNPEFTQAEAEQEARYYAASIGRLPAFLFRDLRTVWIHKGMNAFGGGNDNLLIHTGQGQSYAASGFLEEIFLHEAAHTSMDAYHASTPRWQEAQTADGVAISTYARENSLREDVAETLVPYLAQAFRSDRINAEDLAKIQEAIPARIQYLDCLNLSMDLLPTTSF
jgi:hypothetical protein